MVINPEDDCAEEAAAIYEGCRMRGKSMADSWKLSMIAYDDCMEEYE